MFCMFPHSNFDDWKWSTDMRCIRNEITSYKIHTLVVGAVLELPAKHAANSAHLAHFCVKLAGLAVLSSW
jgi:hypothetical protein